MGRAAGKSGGGAGSSPPEPPVSVLERTVQLTMFDAAPDPVRERLRRTDVNGLTPMQALSLLADLAAEARKP